MPLHARTNIAFAGLTAAGKTTHARLLADHLGYKYVSATEILLDILGFSDQDTKGVWFQHMDEIEQARADESVDEELEARLINLAASEDGLVLDTWALPWISSAPLVRIWIESDRLSRHWKCYVSQGDNPQLTLEECAALIDRKDGTTRQSFLKRHGFDLFSDHGIFDAILTNTYMIDSPTAPATDLGILTFEPVMRMVTEYLLGERSEKSYAALINRLSELGSVQSESLLSLTADVR